MGNKMKQEELLLAFYGDDFTGSTDAMEALTLSGYRTVLFLEPPSQKQLHKFEGIQCIGVAGTGRAKDKEGLKDELRPIMKSLSESGARIVHYKTCSTFDSSPEIGNIGYAITISRDSFPDQQVVPLLVGAPQLGRYTLFGNHFAKSKDEIYRLDRHPIMSKHPVTPMNEADLRVHLSNLFDEPVRLLDLVTLQKDYIELEECYNKALAGGKSVVLHDVLNEETLTKSGKLMWNNSNAFPQFVVGSSGVEYALANYWSSELELPKNRQEDGELTAVNQVFVVSGSASSISAEQIEHALSVGYVGIQVPVEEFFKSEHAEFLGRIKGLVQDGKNVILYTAKGPNDPFVQSTLELFEEKNIAPHESSKILGQKLGQWTKSIIEDTGIHRVIIAGGDTSGFVSKELEIEALEIIQPISPGAPLCKVYSNHPKMNNLQLALKGGQFGGCDYFENVRRAKLE